MSLILFTDALSGNDNAGGSSEGSPKASGVDAIVTSGNQTIDLSGDFPDLSLVASGDTIRIAGRNDGINNSDIFEITSVDDGADTVDIVQVPASGGSNIIWAIGGAFKTIQKPIDFIDLGDKLWIKASAVYSETISVQRSASSTQPIVIEGYLSTIGDLGIPEINGGGTLANGWETFGSADFFILKNLRFTNFTNNGLNGQSSTRIRVDRCRFDNNANYGCRLGGLAIYTMCYFHNNGIDGTLPGGQVNTFLSCIASDNNQNGITTGRQSLTLGCLLFGNLQKNIHVSDLVSRSLIINCTIDGKNQTSSVGINMGSLSSGGLSAVNNIIVGCVTGMISLSQITRSTISLHNLLFNNTVNYSLFGTQDGEILSDPLFTDADIFDYSLQPNSPAIGSGLGLSNQNFVTFTNPVSPIGAFFAQQVAGINNSSDSESLFIEGSERLQTSGNLVIRGRDTFQASGNMYVEGHLDFATSGDMFIKGSERLQTSGDLITLGRDTFQASGNMYVEGHLDFATSGDMFIKGSERLQTSGDLITLGRDTFQASGNIYVEGHLDFTTSSDMFIEGRIGLSASGDFFTKGIDSLSVSGNLFMHGQKLEEINNSPDGESLFIRGIIIAKTSVASINLFINGVEPKPSTACPILDPTASIQIKDSLIRVYQSRIDALINQLGKNVTLEFDPIVTPCPNCTFDRIRKRSTGIYIPGGPRPFSRGRTCPWCKGIGLLETSVTKCIQCLIKWNPEDAENFGISITQKKGIVRFKTFLTEVDDLTRAKTAIANKDIEDQMLLRVRLIQGPIPVGLRERRYCISFWELI